MSELYDLFQRNFPSCVREKTVAQMLLENPENRVLQHRTPDGALAGAAVVHHSNLLLLCVDAAHRGRGVGSRLLTESEQYVRGMGYTEMTVGAGEGYLMPGVPSENPIIPEASMPKAASNGPDGDPVGFFVHHSWQHSWGCNCFDMQMKLSDFSAGAAPVGDLVFRWAEASDMPAILRCTDAAEPSFSTYYADPSLYHSGNRRVLLAENGECVAGTLITGFGTEAPGIGSLGCTAVHPEHQGRGIATQLVIRATAALKDAGLERSFIGYTYSGLEKLYGRAGYSISAYYFMGKKLLC